LRFNIPSIWVFSGVLALLGTACPVQALQVNPGRTELRLPPGTTTSINITATNDGPEALEIDVSPKDWFVLPENKGLTFDKWLHVQGETDFWLKPGEYRTMHIVVECPAKAEGELVGMVSFSYRTKQPSMVTPMISVSVYVEALGNTRAAGEITEMTADFWQGKIVMGTALKATGNVHLRPTGRMSILDRKGRTLGEFPVPEGNPVYPGRLMGFTAAVPPSFKLPPGRYTLVAEMSYRDLVWSGRRGFTAAKDGKITMEAQKEKPVK